jgi:hypothetical protein
MIVITKARLATLHDHQVDGLLVIAPDLIETGLWK